MEEGALVEIKSPMSIIPAMVLGGKYLDLKTGVECSHAGCVVSEVDHVSSLSEEDWKFFNEAMKIGWTDEARAGAAAARVGGAKPKKGLTGELRAAGEKEGSSLQSGMKKEGCLVEGKPKVTIAQKHGAFGTAENIGNYTQMDVTQKYFDGTMTTRSAFSKAGKPVRSFHDGVGRDKHYVFNKGKPTETGFSNLKEAVSFGKSVHAPGRREVMGQL